MRKIAMMMLATTASMAMPKTFADESGKSQTTDETVAGQNNVTTTDTGANAQGDLKTGDAALTDEQFSDPAATRDPNATAGAADVDASAARISRDVVPPEYRDKYASGNGTCGDFIATELSSMGKDGGTASLNSVKEENGIPSNRWSEFNNGMQRMNLANVLRGSFLRGEAIKINGKEYSLAASLAEYEGEGEDREPINLGDANEIGKLIKMIDLQDTERTRNAIKKALGPKPEKKAVKTAEEREAEKKAKEEERAKAKAEKDAKKAEEKAKRDAERNKATEEREAAKKKAADEREAAKKAREEEAAKAKAERETAQKARAEEKAKAAQEREAAKAQNTKAVENQPEAAKDDAKKAATAKANDQKGKNKSAGAVK